MSAHVLLDRTALRGVRALVVEDDADGRALVEEILAGCGASVATASTGREALSLVLSFRPTVILTDIHLPREDGFWLLAQLRAMPRADGGLMPTVAMSGGTSAPEARRAGFADHIMKPIDIERLLDVVRRLGLGEGP